MPKGKVKHYATCFRGRTFEVGSGKQVKVKKGNAPINHYAPTGAMFDINWDKIISDANNKVSNEKLIKDRK